MLIDERVREHLARSTRFCDIRILDVTESTNRVVSELAASGAAEGLVVTAEAQSAGRGRLGRSWESQPGAGLLVSVLLRPSGLGVSRWHLVTAAAGLAAADACVAVAAVEPDIKWPNDLVIADRKLAGILAESVGRQSAAAIVVGMGLNVHAGPPGAAVLDVAAGHRISRPALLAAWLEGLDRLLGDWERVASRYKQECSTIGRAVRVEQAGGDLEGVAEAIDDDGRLIVCSRPRGQRVVVAAGDVVHLRSR